MSHVIRVQVEDGKMRSPALKQFLATAKAGTYYFTIDEVKPKRSIAQNNYYWGAYLPLLSRETGYTVDELHSLFKTKFLQQRVADIEMNGERMLVPIEGSTTSLSKLEFSEYIEKVEAFTGIQSPPTAEYGL